MANPSLPLRLNVGFIVAQNIGYSRDFLFDIPKIHLPPDLDLTDLTGSARISKTPQGLPLQVKMSANFASTCGRCLDPIQQPLQIEFTEMYAFDQRSVSESGLILPDDMHIDLAPLVREYMLLTIPINALCKEDCKGLCPICGENLNRNDHRHTTEEIDPRLSKLQSLLDENETEE